MMVETLARGEGLQRIFMSVHGGSHDDRFKSGTGEDVPSLSMLQSMERPKPIRVGVLSEPNKGQDIACGTWWHSALPRTDPVGLTWRDEESEAQGTSDQTSWTERLVYCDHGETFAPHTAV